MRQAAGSLAVLALAASTLLAVGATPAQAVTVGATPTWPISNADFGPPPVPSMPTAGATAPPAEAIADPVTAGAICGTWHQQGNYGNRWPAPSTWWEYSCSREETYYDDGCPPVGMCDWSNEVWEYQIWTDYFYWNGSEPVFYGEAYSDSWYCCGGFSGTDDYWWDSWDSSSARWYNLTGTPPPTVQQLTVSKPGSGSGTVTSNPAGIDCGTTCVVDFPPGTAVTLTASPGDSSTFTGWSGACTGTALTCQVTMDQARSVTATFTNTPASFALTVAKTGTGAGTISSAPAGVGCGTTCRANFDAGTQVTLTATPDPGAVFTGWSGECTGTGTCVVTMDNARSVSAAFAVDTPPRADLTIACTGLTCTFDAGPSGDAEGPIAGYDWAFGDGASAAGRIATHTYARAGAYPITLRVTDSAGATATASKTINPIALSARGYKQTGASKVALSWSAPGSTSVAIYRNGTKIATTTTTSYTDNLGTRKGTFTYQVCVPADPICSNNSSVTL